MAPIVSAHKSVASFPLFYHPISHILLLMCYHAGLYWHLCVSGLGEKGIHDHSGECKIHWGARMCKFH